MVGSIFFSIFAPLLFKRTLYIVLKRCLLYFPHPATFRSRLSDMSHNREALTGPQEREFGVKAKLRAELLRREDGSVHDDPLDFFHPYGVEIGIWLQQVHPNPSSPFETKESDVAKRKALMFAQAQHIYETYSTKGEPLRGEPYVVESYNIPDEDKTTWFIFKEENNGTTYKIFYKGYF